MADDPHARVRVRDKLLDAVVGRLRKRRDTRELASQVEHLSGLIRGIERDELDALDFGKRLEDVVGEHIDAFVKRPPQDKGQSTLQPVLDQLEGAALHFRESIPPKPNPEDLAAQIQYVWRVHYKQPRDAPAEFVSEFVKEITEHARTPKEIAFRLLHATPRLNHQDLDDLRRKLARVKPRLFK